MCHKCGLKKQKTKQNLTLPDFRQYYKATVIKSVVLVQKQTYRPWNRETNPDSYGQLILAKEARLSNGAKAVSSASDAGKTTAACTSVKLGHVLTLCTKINSKWLGDLNKTRHHKAPRRERRQNLLWQQTLQMFP